MSLVRSSCDLLRALSLGNSVHRKGLHLSSRCLMPVSAHIGPRSKKRAPILRELKKRVDSLEKKGLYPKRIRSEHIEWNHKAELYAFSQRLNEKFDQHLLLQAFTDPSHLRKEEQRLQELSGEGRLEISSNKDLSLEGYQQMEVFISKYIAKKIPFLPEPGLRSFVGYLLSEETLAHVAKGLGCRDLILTEEHPPSTETYARCLCAIVQTLFESSGAERSQQFVVDFVLTQIVGLDLFDVWKVDEPWPLLGRTMAARGLGEPEGRLIGQLGPGTLESVYHVGIYSNEKELIGKGFGQTVAEAKDAAALDALRHLFKYEISREPWDYRLS